ncbi:hypothetical protein BJY04DRAFT_204201 [Aspergillus karnatakaensis]|uniref:uncharacterized protein n=1 Tax=Aspergillus karnatakaensis TaxID=1810916 RepID=UPI003CCD2DD8
MILAAELLLRLDATVRVGLLRASHDLQISTRDIRDFKQLRTAKVNWDMVAVRRLMDSFNFEYDVRDFQLEDASNDDLACRTKENESAWACDLIPEHVDRQLQGLLLFAESIGWVQIAELKEYIHSICQNGTSDEVRHAYNRPLQNNPAGYRQSGNVMYSRSETYRPLLLRQFDHNTDFRSLGGWLTRTWLSGLVLPGAGISHLLMACLLETDADALLTLGPFANLFGGFSYGGRSWWSQECIVNRVLASLPGTDTCMGWMGTDIRPKGAETSKSLNNTWFEVDAMNPPACPGGPRIKQGKKISLKSTPVGLGDLTSAAFSLPTDIQDDRFSNIQIEFQSLVFDTIPQKLHVSKHALSVKATMLFSLRSGKKTPKRISFPLAHNVQFISSHECRPPGGLTMYSAPNKHQNRSARRQSARLPGHPLHRSYAYEIIHVDALPEKAASESRAANVEFYRSLMWHKIMVLDARGGPEHEAFARAWCASIGYHAVIGRIGRTCLACCIREARAVKVRVVIRVGDEGSSRPSSKVSSRISIALGETAVHTSHPH